MIHLGVGDTLVLFGPDNGEVAYILQRVGVDLKGKTRLGDVFLVLLL